MALKVYNTLTRKKEVFKPRKGKNVNIFVCGPTVYDFAHIGHARSYVVFDVIVKYLRYKGYKVNYIQNITDVDDKIINRAKESNKDPQKLAREFEKAYFEDISELGINAVNSYVPASQHIKEIINQIQRLIGKKYAYVAEDGVWFNISKFKDYGKLSRQNPEELREHRIELSKYKKAPADFSLWKRQKQSELAWDSPWGKGRPGWHIEDTAITEKYFGPQYDIHGGGQDLIFPHHEAEIAQMESISGKKPLAKYWLHNGFLLVNGEKMSKSLGNFTTIRGALKKYKPQTLRLFFAATHYRAPIDYSEKALDNATSIYKKFEEFILRLKGCTKEKSDKAIKKSIVFLIKRLKNGFESEMDSDFNIAGALVHIHEFMSQVNRLLDAKILDKTNANSALEALYDLDSILGLGLKEIREGRLAIDVKKLIKQREQARKNKDFKTADKIRNQLAGKGIILEDQPEGGTRWKIVK
jgi:cysteinyl-tRNA synthetase